MNHQRNWKQSLLFKLQSHLAVHSHSTISSLLLGLLAYGGRHFEVLGLLDGSFPELSRPVLSLLQT